ncbi:hypothetical protein GRI43_12905 [Altererythrobacter luteolus]|uniref:Hemerythrin-like domain-containing protein n=1 Tax=Pontixanthobacter luteolus TaxID=295089 RepID=A0A6I4V3N6_9SPHN|nr:hemerythrin domain-containing protein [Pontixanthobacter luteolus]MXP48288.1 hypothetical protein [Pontixanthobacter luteolus]
MSDPVKELLAEFHRDHAVLGRGLYRLGTALRDRDILSAKKIADELDREAGPHIAFEEQCFYPALRPLIGDEEVDRFYEEHEAGKDVLTLIRSMPDEAWPDAKRMEQMLSEVENMEHHVTECGEMFGAMGRIPADEQRTMLAKLAELREADIRWSEVAPAKRAAPSKSAE